MIGCLIEFIWILKFRFDTLIPNVNSQAFLTKGNFTRDEWNNLLHLFNISHFSSTCCAKIDKVPQNDGEKYAGTKGRRMKCGEIEIYSDELVFPCFDKFLIRERSDCIQRSDCTHSYRDPWREGKKKSKSDAASISQVRLQDAYLGGLMDTATGRPVATREESGDVDLSESETGSEEDVTGRPVFFFF